MEREWQDMNSIIRRHRLRQPRSNFATNALFVISAAVFAVIGNVALEQQRDVTVADQRAPATEPRTEPRQSDFVQAFDLQALLPQLLF